jgi:streptomycin 6-kinase
MLELHGEQGLAWLEDLPQLVEQTAKRWSLLLGAPFEGLSYSYVAPGRRADGTQVVLKCTIPNRELTTEVQALRAYDGGGAVRLLEDDAEQGLILLERIMPGTALCALPDDEEATAIAIEVMRSLWRPAPARHSFPTVGDWGKGFHRLRQCFAGGTGPFPQEWVEKAEQRFAELSATMESPVLLHGDLHHWNILRSDERGWLAIDPKGVVGERAYEPGAWLRNPYPDLLRWLDLAHTTNRRLDQLAEGLGLGRQRLAGWAFSQAVLSAWWSYADNAQDWPRQLGLAEMLGQLV